MTDRRKIMLPVAILIGAMTAGAALIATKPEIETIETERAAVVVRALEAHPTTVQMLVRSQGTVAPRTESELIPEVSGRVEWVAPSLVTGGFFEQGDVLLRIDPVDYTAAVERARAQRARAQGEYEYAASRLARQVRLSHESVASASQYDDAQRAARVTQATLEEAKVALAQAQRDLERTEVRAPFAGRVRNERVDVGQFVSRGASIGTLYATDYVEIRLPIPDEDLAYLDMPLWNRAGANDAGPAVLLRARFAGALHEWPGRIVRTEGEIDKRSRVVHVVARVENPYEPGEHPGRPPLAVGLFVHAEIVGPSIRDVIELPRSALREGRDVLVVDLDDRIRIRSAEVVRVDRERAFVRLELAPGERICISVLQVVLEGMKVQTIDAALAGRS